MAIFMGKMNPSSPIIMSDAKTAIDFIRTIMDGTSKIIYLFTMVIFNSYVTLPEGIFFNYRKKADVHEQEDVRSRDSIKL